MERLWFEVFCDGKTKAGVAGSFHRQPPHDLHFSVRITSIRRSYAIGSQPGITKNIRDANAVIP